MESMSYYLYALVNDNGRIYIGISCNPKKRLKEHKSGKTKSTEGYIPWKIFFVERCNSRQEAREREKYCKSRLSNLLIYYNAPVAQ
ncbi:GIY-YIG nuclease family protein [candidate division WOR-3 bacterium]|nr:GIY-YIG nuclease family protein [candidate division WOR-3 bacterium]